MKKYTGIIVEESLESKRFLESVIIKHTQTTDETDPQKVWHMHAVEVTDEQIEELSYYIKPEKWYADFSNEDEMVIVFRNNIFRFKRDDKDSWAKAIEYGKSVGIPDEQLDFGAI